jgi:hypothetical protein
MFLVVPKKKSVSCCVIGEMKVIKCPIVQTWKQKRKQIGAGSWLYHMTNNVWELKYFALHLDGIPLIFIRVILTNAPTFIIEVVRIVDHIFLENKRNEKLGGIIVIQNLFEIEAMICSFLFQFSFHFMCVQK